MTDTMPEKIDLASVTPGEEKLAALRDLIPEVFTEGKIDFDALRNSLGDAVATEPREERFGLRWPGKSRLQTVINQPSVGTLIPQPDESVDWDTTQNMIIEGDNLEVLKLLQKGYAGKVKMIYIDPPYNTGGDFIYPDNFREGLQSYLEFTGQSDNEGNRLSANTESVGRYHSNWLNMMFPRIYLSRNLLSDDGFVFVSIDDHEVHNLRSLMNEVFGEENFRNMIVVRRGTKNVQAQFSDISNLSSGHEYVLCYSRNSTARLPKLSHDSVGMQAGKWDTFWRGTDRPTMRYELFGHFPKSGQWRWEKNRTKRAAGNYAQFLAATPHPGLLDDYFLNHLQSTNEKLDFVRLNDDGVVQYYVPPRDFKLLSDNWMDVSIGGSETDFSTEKHVDLLSRIIKWVADDGDVVLDFFAGSGSTGHAVMKQNGIDGLRRRYILVQLPEPVGRVETLDNGVTIRTIADLCRDRVRRAGQKVTTRTGPSVDIGFRAYKLAPSNFRPWDGRTLEMMTSARQVSFMPQTIQQQLELAADHLRPDANDDALLAELLLRLGFELTTPVRTEMLAGKTVYNVDDGLVMICLDRHLSLDVIREMAARMPAEIICLDAGFPDDATKVNAGQIIASQARDEETSIAFKVV